MDLRRFKFCKMGHQMKRLVEKYSIKELMEGALQNGYFMRLDVIINYIGIEAYYGENKWDLYEKYEITSDKDVLSSKDKFIELIQSFEKNGCLSDRHALKLSNNVFLNIRDGAHRVACALYFGHEYIYGYIQNSTPLSLMDRGYRLLKKRGFTNCELEALENKKNKIFENIGGENG